MGVSCEPIADPETFHANKPYQGITMQRSNMNRELKEIKGALGRLERQIRKEYKAEIIGLFGSYVRGEQKDESDVDVLVRFLDGATLFDFVGLADFLEERLSLEVDIVSERALRPELREQILKDVVSV
jgi:predicted nucleotidyltransferase